MSQLRKTLEYFEDYLRRRFESKAKTTEDSVRYTFFAALLKAGVEPHQVVQELPHPKLPNKEVDTFIENLEGRPTYLEFKYDRHSGKTAQNKTNRSGAFLKDLLRLSMIDTQGIRRLFVYVTDEGMGVYFRNPKNGYCKFFTSSEEWAGVSKSFIEKRPKSALNRLAMDPFDLSIRSLSSFEFRSGADFKYGWVFEVQKGLPGNSG
jgi:hypothetical protein